MPAGCWAVLCLSALICAFFNPYRHVLNQIVPDPTYLSVHFSVNCRGIALAKITNLSPLSTERNNESEILEAVRVGCGDSRDAAGSERHRQRSGKARSWRGAEAGESGRTRATTAGTTTSTTEPPRRTAREPAATLGTTPSGTTEQRSGTTAALGTAAPATTAAKPGTAATLGAAAPAETQR